MTRPFPPRYFIASIALLLVLVGLYTISAARRNQRELLKQLEEKGMALAEAVETSSRNAIRGNALIEEMIAQRLVDNARLIDLLLLSRSLDRAAVERITAMNRLRRVDLLDRDGHPYTPPPSPRGMMGMMRGPMAGEIPEPHRSMMIYMWGRQWGLPQEGAAPAPPAVKNREFWEGSLFGVAVEARSFPGIIAVHADADYILNFRREIGVERQIEELGRQRGVEEVALLGPDLAVLAHSDPGRIGQRDEDGTLSQALRERRNLSRLVRGEGGREVFQVVRPLSLDGSRLGLLRVALSTAPMERIWREDLRSAVVLGAVLLLAGALGMGAIFYIQHRHLREVRGLEAEVEQRERLSALGNLAAAVAHEVRNPLNAISVGLQRLREEFRPAANHAEYARFVDLMQGEVKRLNGIVEEFLSLARPISLKLDLVRVGELLQEVTALVQADAGARGVRLSLAVPRDLPAARL
ncbi:MAG: histidine kinase dimerization/phospho-acceptor domain-containing protein, partial [candidate division NC10 bacterium]